MVSHRKGFGPGASGAHKGPWAETQISVRTDRTNIPAHVQDLHHTRTSQPSEPKRGTSMSAPIPDRRSLRAPRLKPEPVSSRSEHQDPTPPSPRTPNDPAPQCLRPSCANQSEPQKEVEQGTLGNPIQPTIDMFKQQCGVASPKRSTSSSRQESSCFDPGALAGIGDAIVGSKYPAANASSGPTDQSNRY